MIFVTGGGLLSRTGQNIQSIRSLADRRVSVVAGTTTESALRTELTEANLNAEVVPVSNHEEGLAALTEGKVDTHAGDRIVLIGLWKNHPKPEQFEVATELFTYEPYGLMVRRGDPEFRLIADRALARLYRNGNIIPIYNRWFGKLGAPSELLRHMYALNGFPD
jgi:ABC-type amino acid transport substrate-binding protein